MQKEQAYSRSSNSIPDGHIFYCWKKTAHNKHFITVHPSLTFKYHTLGCNLSKRYNPCSCCQFSVHFSVNHSIILLLLNIINFIIICFQVFSNISYFISLLNEPILFESRVGWELEDNCPPISIFYNEYIEILLWLREQIVIRLLKTLLIRRDFPIFFVALLWSFNWIYVQKL